MRRPPAPSRANAPARTPYGHAHVGNELKVGRWRRWHRLLRLASCTPLHAHVNKIYSIGRGVAFASATVPSESLWNGLLAESAAHRLAIFSSAARLVVPSSTSHLTPALRR